MEDSMEVLKKTLKTELPYDPAIPLLGIHLKEMQTGYQRAFCKPMFTTALFITAKTWKQSEVFHDGSMYKENVIYVCYFFLYPCIQTHIHVYKHTHTHTYEYSSAIKRK